MTKSTKVIVFDLDGVLINSEEANYQAFAYGIEQLGLPRPSREAVVLLIGLKAQQMLEKLGCPSSKTLEVSEKYVKPFYLENLPTLAQPIPEAASVLATLQARHYRIFACTSGDRRIQTAALSGIGLLDAIEKMQAADDSRYAKPDPQYLQELLADLTPSRLLHVEDAEVGIRMGNACGATTIFAEYGYGSLSPEITADYRISQLPDLLLIAD